MLETITITAEAAIGAAEAIGAAVIGTAITAAARAAFLSAEAVRGSG